MSEGMTAKEREIEMRREAEEHRGQPIEGSGVAIEGRRLGEMVSLRLEADLAVALRELAQNRGVSMSELIRQAAASLVSGSASVAEVTFFGHTSRSGETWAQIFQHTASGNPVRTSA